MVNSKIIIFIDEQYPLFIHGGRRRFLGGHAPTRPFVGNTVTAISSY
jgi:hypothetical protein